jgi:hypothetical protein
MRLKCLPLGLAAAAGAAVTPSVLAESIGINFIGGGGGPGNDAADVRSLAPTDVAGVVPSRNWNNLTGFNATQGGLLNGSGATTSASVTWATNGVWTAHDTPAGATPDQILTNGYIDDTTVAPDPPTTINFTGIPFIGPYDVYLYFGSDGNDRTGSATIGATTIFFATNTNPFDGTFTAATPADDGAADDGEYALFSGVTGSSFNLTVTRISNNVGVHGVQIVGTTIPEPATAGLLGFAATTLLALRRRRT